MDTLHVDPSHKLEVRMYSRDVAEFTELFYVDHEGHERIVCQWRRADMPVVMSAASSVAPVVQAAPALQEAPSWELSQLLEAAEGLSQPDSGDGSMQPPPDLAANYNKIDIKPEPEPRELSLPEAKQHLAPHDTARRRAAKAAIRTTVAAISRNTYDLQMRYELALQARNKQTRALELFDREAKAAGVPLAEVIDKVISDRKAREDLMMRVYALQAHALAALDKAWGEDIAEVEANALAEINGA